MPNDPRKKNTNRGALLAGGYTTIVVGFLAVVMFPYVQATRAAERDIARNRDEIETRNAKAGQLDDLRRRIELMDLQTRNFDRLVPANQDQGQFLTELSEQLEAAGMRDPMVSAMSPTSLGKSQRLPIEVRGKGTFAQFHEFLTRVEGLKRMSSVGKLAVDAETDMSGTVSAEVTLFIYNTKPGP